MKFPKEVNAYCPSCKKHTKQKAKAASKGRPRTLAAGNRAHQRSLMGRGSKRAGEKTVKKQGKRQKIVLQCPECKKKQERVVGGRTTRKIEFKS
ncbi:MAG: 50S ribosomal protein L44e [Candidatus Micrarchaeota archaeon]